jgi:O-antigen/teichoic acid export membrane protein
MLKFGVFMFLSGVLDSVYSKIDIFLIAKMFSPVSLGYYTRAQGLDSTIRTLSSGSLLNVLFPTFAKIREDKVELKKLYYQYFELISFLFCLLGGVFYLGADQLFFILFGSKWAISATYFKILILAGFAYPLSSLSLSIMEARGNSKNFFIVEILKKILFFPTYIIAYYYGINYFLYSFVLACFIGTFFNVRFAKFEIDIDVSETIVILLKYLFSSFIFILFFTIYGKSFLVNFPFIQTTVQIVLFLILYLFTHFIFKNAGIKFLLEIIKSRK